MGILYQANDQPLTVLPAGIQNGPAFLQKLLHSHGIRSVVTGALRYADTGLEDCGCPYRSRGECGCYEVVLLVYGGSEPPLTLILACRGPWTCVYLCLSSVNPGNQETRQCLVNLLASEDNDSAFENQIPSGPDN